MKTKFDGREAELQSAKKQADLYAKAVETGTRLRTERNDWRDKANAAEQADREARTELTKLEEKVRSEEEARSTERSNAESVLEGMEKERDEAQEELGALKQTHALTLEELRLLKENQNEDQRVQDLRDKLSKNVEALLAAKAEVKQVQGHADTHRANAEKAAQDLQEAKTRADRAEERQKELEDQVAAKGQRCKGKYKI